MNTTITLLTKAEFKKHLKQHTVIDTYYNTPAGTLWVQSTELGVFNAAYKVQEIAHANTASVLKRIILVGTNFQVKVWQAVLKIPAGATLTYHDIAQTIGKPRAYRAVANALAQNKIIFFIPCHRVTKKDGKLGGYAYGIDKKLALLTAERL
ncbi:MAG: MGMT family protein [Candidatus Babeliaceae bacterium]|nr:MGMT family protein [Candidatus Babeliaceae bacterium]